ncbi:GspH/FimT family pseudopilin [Colwellia hornerae]|uniref:Type II secretion system protein H n=1 Tax=Colwellia hornerae TaxID=89402 RepID=A0A5C6Q9W0_9GAMM|nr:GspH/FimT family pseudopilin [Colwellia hornerae]TWX50671.1 pilus assembly protein [Colwellia hornerae]TWX56413.1 pilus assembly protein [Colwellia hornerae]TWX65387.1 pilus assembly protein [Colwellia hornerae]
MLYFTLKIKGFTLIETLITLAILIVLTVIAIPTFADLRIRIRVDNEISALHRLLLLTRNHAVNQERFVTVCPLNSSGQCSNEWHKTLTVFYDDNKNKTLDASSAEVIIKIKSAIKSGDKLQYAQGRTALIYAPSGRLAVWGGNGTFRYCPKSHSGKSRGIIISGAGRFYLSTDQNMDGADENRSGRIISCH